MRQRRLSLPGKIYTPTLTHPINNHKQVQFILVLVLVFVFLRLNPDFQCSNSNPYNPTRPSGKMAGRWNGYAVPHLKGDRELVLEAVRHYGRAGRWNGYAAAHLRGDRDIVLEAVRQNGRAGRYFMRQSI
jgi:hypothetical protein